MPRRIAFWPTLFASCALLLGAVSLAEAKVLCASPLGSVKIREGCRRHEVVVDVRELMAAVSDPVPLANWEVDGVSAAPEGLESVSAVNSSSVVPVTPCRLIDTRIGSSSEIPGDDIGPFADFEMRTYTLEGYCGIPAGATGVSINLAIVPGVQAGFASVGPSGSIPAFPPGPKFASINYVGSGPPISNSLVVPLDTLGRLDVYAARSAEVIIDTNGYLAPPGDDDGNTAYGVDSLLSITTGEHNTAIGEAALTSTSEGRWNVAVGYAALEENQDGDWNTAIGKEALEANVDGNSNVAIGGRALEANVDGSSNLAVGPFALNDNVSGFHNVAVGHAAVSKGTGDANVAVGYKALADTVAGNSNVAVGRFALESHGASSTNVAVGAEALRGLTGGIGNVAIGYRAGEYLLTGSSNILIDNRGTTSESGTIRLGSTQTATYIAGIDGQSVDQMTPVYVGSDGKLGTTIASSRGLKQDVADVGERSRALLELRPVSFAYKTTPEREHFGLIAEEAAEVLPEIVVFDDEGRPAAVRYDKLTPLLLSELQRAHRLIQEQGQRIEALSAKRDS